MDYWEKQSLDEPLQLIQDIESNVECFLSPNEIINKLKNYIKSLSADHKTLKEKFEKLKAWYIKNYTALAKHYLEKLDATKFLNIYATKKDKYFMPNNENIKSFVEYYFKRYQEIGQELDTFDKKENYIK